MIEVRKLFNFVPQFLRLRPPVSRRGLLTFENGHVTYETTSADNSAAPLSIDAATRSLTRLNLTKTDQAIQFMTENGVSLPGTSNRTSHLSMSYIDALEGVVDVQRAARHVAVATWGSGCEALTKEITKFWTFSHRSDQFPNHRNLATAELQALDWIWHGFSRDAERIWAQPPAWDTECSPAEANLISVLNTYACLDITAVSPLDCTPAPVNGLAALSLQLIESLAQGQLTRVCLAEGCENLFVLQKGRALNGQNRRRGVSYCSRSCARRQVQRNRRREMKEGTT